MKNILLFDSSFMYDLIAGCPPFHQEEVDSILWRIGSGQTTQLGETKCNDRLKVFLKINALPFNPLKIMFDG